MYIEHKVFGIKKNVNYMDREGAYLLPAKDGKVGVVKTSKGYFLLGGDCGKEVKFEKTLDIPLGETFILGAGGKKR